ncbi:MAG: hypothetical protein HQL14_08305 [Candidatus Omnitrophica bacterium]|nr:hypothetical protein [Candidatus Omnitrophota bacterium]
MRGTKIISILVALFILRAFAYAQEWPSTAKIVEKVRTDLNLNQEQFDKVRLIIEDNMAKRKQIASESTQGLTTTAQSRELDSQLYSKLRDVLTDYQMRQWNKILDSINQDMDAESFQNSKNQPLPKN